MPDNILETTLGVFLDSRRTVEKGDVSFTGMGTIRGKFMVKDEDYLDFLNLLHEYLFEEKRRPLNLVEQRRNDLYTPILIDIDFKYPSERAIQRQFDLSHIHAFIEKYVENLTHFYVINKPLRFFITLRPAPYEDKKTNHVKDGVHIQKMDGSFMASRNQIFQPIICHLFMFTTRVHSQKRPIIIPVDNLSSFYRFVIIYITN